MKLLEILERDDGCLSLGRIISILIFLLWFIITILAFMRGNSFAHYDMLSYTMLASLFSVICGKWVDNKHPRIPKVGDV